MPLDLLEDEEALLEAALAGDRRAFGELARLHHPRALALATGIVGNREEARDLVQESCLKAYRALGKFQRGRPFFPWFYRILRNACIQHLRSRKVRKAASLQTRLDDGEEILEFVDRSAPLPEEIVERDEHSQLIGAALAALPPADSEILMLKHFDGLSYKEIASALSIPVGTVMSRLHAARSRLRNLVPELA